MSLQRASGRYETLADVAARAEGRRLREFPPGHQDQDQAQRQVMPTRAQLMDVLLGLARGVDAERLLERVAGHEHAHDLRAVLLEAGAQALAQQAGKVGAGAQREPGVSGVDGPARPCPPLR
jgi:hypothetical protein